MTVSSWFRSEKKQLSAKEAVKLMYPKPTVETNRNRFSQLLLEHGEKPLQDWAVIAFSNPAPIETKPTHTTDEIQWEQSPYKKPIKQQKRKSNMIDKDTYPSAHMSKIEGRLHLCTGSLVFEPDSSTRGIVRCPFSKMVQSPVEHPSEAGFENLCVELIAKKHLVMKINNMIGPYDTVSAPCRFRFTFLHSSPKAFVELCQKLFNINQTRHNTTELEALIRSIIDKPFLRDNLVDVREQLLTGNLRCAILTPLQSKPGTFVASTERIYFQAYNSSTLSWLQSNVVATARRYNGLRDSALEIFWKDETSILFTFERRHDRETVMRFLSNNKVPCFTDREFVVEVVREWVRGNISNYEYLLALNSASGRSFHDLSRYPVFPWVIADYESDKLDLTNPSTFRDLSKPVGALNETRLEYFQGRLKGMQDMEEAFLYGTHYSAPGYVLYFLVRSMPEHMLCLQNGKFDAPDRMFHSVSRCYSCALTNHADVKELIPEFYNAGHDFDFLINAKGLQLGATQNGDRVNDVTLPPWARSPRDFIKKNRKALESDLCTRMLPKWIDLIFGCKSRGEGAMEANNVFHHNAYLGPIDLAGMQTEEQRFQAELQATEFGIVPDMLFRGEHLLKGDTFNEDFISPDLGRASSKDESGREAWELLDAPTNDTESHSRVGIVVDQPELEPVNETKPSVEMILPVTRTTYDKNSSRHNLPLRGSGETLSRDQSRDDHGFGGPEQPNTPASSPQNRHQEDSPQVQQTVEAASSGWDMKILEQKQIHGDAVSGCVLFLDETAGALSILVTSSLDGGLIVHKVALNSQDADSASNKAASASPFSRFTYSTIINRSGQASQTSSQSKLTEYRTHTSRDPLASLVLASDNAGGSVAFAGGHDDVVLAYGIKSACAVASVYSHRDAVTGLDLVPRTPFDAESALWLENSTHILVSGSWDATVKVWSVSVASGEAVSVHREPLAELFDADSSIVCVSSKSIPNGGIYIAAGCANGSFCVWDLHNDGMQILIHNEASSRRGSGPCSVLKWASSPSGALFMFAAFSTGKLVSYAVKDGALHRVNAVSLGVAITCLAYMEGILLVGCSDGGLRLLPLRDTAYFHSKPTLWPAVNNKSTSPGLSSMSLAIAEQTRCICSTGAEDGSVVMFELKSAK